MAMGFLDAQPVEFKDFSGGLTDNFLQGDPKRYAIADNFTLTVDHKLQVRDGTVIYDPVGSALGPDRVAGLFTNLSETLLFGHMNRDLYTQAPDSRYGTAWTRITGPTGNEALPSGGKYAQVTHGEFQRQMYFTSDAATQPGKLFKDHTNTWKSVTAGLPRMAFTPNYSDNATLVTACIALANLLRASMLAHYADQANILTGTDVNFQHKYLDKYSQSYFQAVVWNFADPEYPGINPVPAPVATDEASLYALTLAMALSYEHHRADLAGAVPSEAAIGNRFYHQDIYLQPTGTAAPYGATGGVLPSFLGLAAKLRLSGSVTTPQKAAAFLDELATKWYWHQLLPFSHSISNDYARMSTHLLTGAGNDSVKIGTLYSSPSTLQVTPNYADFAAFALWIKTAMNKHALGTGASGVSMHSQADPYGEIKVPDPVDFDSAALTIFWARFLYGNFHSFDANVGAHTRISFTTVVGSPNINTVVTTSTGAALTLPVDSWILVTTNRFATTPRAARVMASALGTATLSVNALASTAGVTAEYSNSWLHGAYINGSVTNALCDTTTFAAGAGEFITAVGTIGSDLKTWIQLGNEFMLCLGAHEKNGNLGPTTLSSHKQSNVLSNDIAGASAINGNPFFIPTPVTLGWAGFYRYFYTVEPNGIQYLNQGAPIFSNSIQTCPSYPVGTIIPTTNATYFQAATIVQENKCATIAGIPGIVNTTITNYDTTVSVAPQPTLTSLTGYYEDLTLELYRTTDGGTTFYYLDSLVNSASQTYLDHTNENYPRPGDTALNLGKVIYTSGGVVANDQPPECKYIHSFNGFMYYGAVTDTGQYFPQRIRQAIQGAPDSAPATFFDDLDDELVGLSSTRSNLIALCKSSAYRLSGSFSSTGQGGMAHERISDAMGGLNAKSIVRTEIGIFYAGTDGFYYTDGYQVIKISLDLDKTYQAHTKSDDQKARIYGAYDKLTRRIWWAMQSQATASDNDVFFVYYLNYGVKPSGVFTKAFATNSWTPSSHTFYKGNLVIGDSRGYLFKTDSATKTDPLVNVATAPTTWRTVHIPYNYTSCAVDFGSTGKRKWVPRIHAVGQNVGNAAIQINTINDSGTLPNGASSGLPLAPIQYTRNFTWGDARLIWGDATFEWKYDGNMDLWRRFPSRSLRSDFKQVQYVPGNFVVYRSDDYPPMAYANVNKGALTATMVTPAGFTSILWPLDIVDLYISFSTDAYATKYLVTSLDATKKIVSFTDPSGTVVTNTTAYWQISGVMKEQRIRINSFNVHVTELGDEFEAYPGASGEGGMGNNA